MLYWTKFRYFSRIRCTHVHPVQKCVPAKSHQSYLTLCDPMDCSPPGSSVHGILQAGILEWIALLSSRGSSWPRVWTQVSCGSCTAGGFFTTELPGKPWSTWKYIYILMLPILKFKLNVLKMIFSDLKIIIIRTIFFVLCLTWHLLETYESACADGPYSYSCLVFNGCT